MRRLLLGELEVAAAVDRAHAQDDPAGAAGPPGQAPLPPGRYVLNLAASDAAGNQTTLARGSSRIVFYVS